jgi:hypothetical protein
MTIQTRQNRKGNWWCNTTYNGEDISVEGKSVYEARFLMIRELYKRKYYGERNWEPEKFYKKPTETVKQEIGYAKSRIDINPIG